MNHDEHIVDDAEIVAEDQPIGTALVHAPASAITRPVADLTTVVDAFQQYQSLRRAVITDDDVQRIGGKEFVTKSGWRKLAVIMGVSSEIISRDYDRDDQGRITRAEVVVRAAAPNGRSIDGLGLCDLRERCCPRAFGADAVCKAKGRHTHCSPGCDGFNHFSKPQHDIPATASTRALNRACSDLFGFGEISAEEVTEVESPAAEDDVIEITRILNELPDDQRKYAKTRFVQTFGLPAELREGQVEQARRFCAALTNTDPDAATATPSVVASDTAIPHEGAQVEQPAASAAGGGEETDLSVSVPPPPPAPSTSGQRQRIAIKCRELAANAQLSQNGKPEIVGLLTGGRTATTTEMTADEAARMYEALTLIGEGCLVMADQALVATDRRGEQFLVGAP